MVKFKLWNSPKNKKSNKQKKYCYFNIDRNRIIGNINVQYGVRENHTGIKLRNLAKKNRERKREIEWVRKRQAMYKKNLKRLLFGCQSLWTVNTFERNKSFIFKKFIIHSISRRCCKLSQHPSIARENWKKKNQTRA